MKITAIPFAFGAWLGVPLGFSNEFAIDATIIMVILAATKTIKWI